MNSTKIYSLHIYYAACVFFCFISLCGIAGIGLKNCDGAAYLMYGIELLDGKFSGHNFPSRLFQIIAAITSGYPFGIVPQTLYVSIFSFLLYIISTLFLFQCLNKFVDRRYALLIILFLSISPYTRLYTYYSMSNLTDAWLIFFCCTAFWCIINNRFMMFGFIFSLGLIIRLQSIFILPAFIVLSDFSKRFFIRSVIGCIIAYIFYYALLAYFGVLSNASGYAFYQELYISKLSIDKVLNSLYNASYAVFKQMLKNYHLRFLIILLVINVIAIIAELYRDKSSIILKLYIFSLIFFLCDIASCICGLLFWGTNTTNDRFDPRYMAYSFPFMVITTAVFMDRCIAIFGPLYVWAIKFIRIIVPITIILATVYFIKSFPATKDKILFSYVDIDRKSIADTFSGSISYCDRYSNFFSGIYFNEKSKMFIDPENPIPDNIKTIFVVQKWFYYNGKESPLKTLENNGYIFGTNPQFKVAHHYKKSNLEFYIFTR